MRAQDVRRVAAGRQESHGTEADDVVRNRVRVVDMPWDGDAEAGELFALLAPAVEPGGVADGEELRLELRARVGCALGDEVPVLGEAEDVEVRDVLGEGDRVVEEPFPHELPQGPVFGVEGAGLLVADAPADEGRAEQVAVGV